MEEKGVATGSYSFARKLASSDVKTREKGMGLLVLWLACQQEVREDELKKIWKGLFYCVWHADKAPVQADLIDRLAGVLENLDLKLSVEFFKAFLSTMRREWGGIDRLRLDKFYLLLRQVLVRVFAVLRKHEWEDSTVEKFMNALLKRALLVKDEFPALGINLHMTDIFLDELRKVQPLSSHTLGLMLEPFYSTIAASSDKSLLKRVRERVFNSLLEDAQGFISRKQESKLDREDETFGAQVLSLPVVTRLFALASAASTPQANRKVLYEICDCFSKLEKLVAVAGVDISSLKAEQAFAVHRYDGNVGDGLRMASGILQDKQKKSKTVGAHEDTEGLSKKKRKVKDLGIGSKNTGVINPAEKTLVEAISVQVNSGNFAGEHVVQIVMNGEQSQVLGKGGNPKKKMKKSKKQRKSAGNAKNLRQGLSHEGSLEARTGGEAEVDGVISDTVANVKKDDEGLIPLAVQQTGEEIRDSSLESFESNFGGLLSPVNTGSKKKRKRGKKGEESEPSSGAEVMQLLPSKVDTPATGSNSSAKKKKVRFMLKNNLVWKQGPLPPQSMRTPPAATPRGSALKKGALPGPIHSSPSLIYQTMPIPRGCSPIQILSVTVQKPSRSPKSLSNGVPKQVMVPGLRFQQLEFPSATILER
ncbi:hypothetical protein CY35_20G010600 [Sphagnum magellanicum]|nr:hypothetical protein CY35_20G010600 [Sphagnum magellanicum]